MSGVIFEASPVPVIGQQNIAGALQPVERVRESHLAEPVMMAECLPVGGYVNQLIPFTLF